MSILGATEITALEAAGIIVGIAVGVVTGVGGLVLGILNHIHQRSISHPRIAVRPRVWNIYDPDTGETIAEEAGIMEVCNIGQVPVRGSLIGFYLKRGTKPACFVKNPSPINGTPWPGEIKPQGVVMLRFDLDSLPNPKMLKRAYVKTSVGDIFKSSRRSMRKFRTQLTQSKQPTSSPAA